MQKNLTVLFAFAIFVLIVGWAITPAQAHCVAGHDHKNCNGGNGNGRGGDDKYSVKVTFDDLHCDTSNPVRDHFCSDNVVYPTRGDYIDGFEDVAAGGDKFRFQLVLRTGTHRRFFLDFSDNCASPSECDVTPSLERDAGLGDAGLTSGGSENVFSTGEPGFSLLDMGEGQTLPRNVQITFNDGVGDRWVLHFDPSQCNGTTRVPVTRTGDTWDFVSNGEIACLERREGGKGPTTSHGRYTVPFKFTVTLQP